MNQEEYEHIEAELEARLRILVSWQSPLTVRMRLKEDSSKWRVASGLQKALRRGLDDLAVQYGLALYRKVPSYFWWRMPICAVEDIGPANEEAVALALLLKNSKKLQVELGEAAIAAVLSGLANGGKSRLNCYTTLCEWPFPSVKAAAPALLAMTTNQLADLFLDVTQPLPQRYRAARLLCGKKGKIPEDAVLPPKVQIGAHWDLLVSESTSSLQAQYVDKAYRKLANDGMQTAHLLWRQQFTAYPEVLQEVVDAGCAEIEKIGSMLACAYDMYTQEGKRAIAYFRQMVPELKEISYDAVCEVVFEAESGRLNRELRPKGFDEFMEPLMEECWARFDMTHADGVALTKLVKLEVEKLNYARKKILTDA